ncbi:MAG: deoxyribose-phosphate aldolase [Tepidanaerobacteraceae bacterium]|nr:deoxyribose-phosphate aldolase [Tepidanaerobacteraceae bacterium]MDN5312363.1 deoxyribose-phosphate aldolase [Thermoanaerobacteraceae bacterium]
MKIKGVEYTKEKLAGIVDYAVLDPNTTESKIKEVCELAKKYGFKGVHPNPYWAPLVADELEGTGIETGLVVSFPFGANPTSFKVHEAKELVKILNKRPGCIDMVTNIGRLKDKDYDLYTNDIAEVVKVGHEAGIEVKAILEVAMLTDDEVKAACECAVKAGVDFVKTSTGRGGNPSIKHVKIMRSSVPSNVGVKFSGYGSYNPAQLTIMALAAGATRLGTRRAPEIIDEIEAYFKELIIE